MGGNYKEPSASNANAAITHDGGKTWKLAESSPHGYRSAVAVVPGNVPHLVAVGTTGADESADQGQKWNHIDDGNYNAVCFAGQVGWAVGPAGRIVESLARRRRQSLITAINKGCQAIVTSAKELNQKVRTKNLFLRLTPLPPGH